MSREWHPRTSFCGATAAKQWGQRRLEAMHANDLEPGENALHWRDGLSIWVSEEPPDPDDDEFA